MVCHFHPEEVCKSTHYDCRMLTRAYQNANSSSSNASLLYKFNSFLVAFKMLKFGLKMAFVFGSRRQSKIVMLFFLKICCHYRYSFCSMKVINFLHMSRLSMELQNNAINRKLLKTLSKNFQVPSILMLRTLQGYFYELFAMHSKD